jgi:hypothetical protein
MPLDSKLLEIHGAQGLYDWFGYWPKFHDAEVVSLHLDRREPSSLLVHTWEMTNKVDDRGYYAMEKHVVVEFLLEEIAKLELHGFSHQNVIFGLDLEKQDEGFVVSLDPCYGLTGTIQAKKITIRLTPGKPKDATEID